MAVVGANEIGIELRVRLQSRQRVSAVEELTKQARARGYARLDGERAALLMFRNYPEAHS
jgi:hypothetical protein